MEAGGARVASSEIFNASLATLCQAFLTALRHRIEPVTRFALLAFLSITTAGLATDNLAVTTTLMIFTWWRFEVDAFIDVAETNRAFVVVTRGLATGLRVAANAHDVRLCIERDPTGRATEIVARGLATLLLGVSNRAVSIGIAIRA